MRTELVEEIALRVFRRCGGRRDHLLPLGAGCWLEVRDPPRSFAKFSFGEDIAKDAEDPAKIKPGLFLGAINVAKVQVGAGAALRKSRCETRVELCQRE